MGGSLPIGDVDVPIANVSEDLCSGEDLALGLRLAGWVLGILMNLFKAQQLLKAND